jgi:hypothetical protein
MLVGAVLTLLVVLGWPSRTPGDRLVNEMVNDHLRVLYEAQPLEIASGGIHQVKPWFEGRLDFAPIVEFAGDDDFPLEGGSVAYVIDRKAAAFLFKRRLHQITLFVFRAEGLRWPTWGLRPIGAAQGTMTTDRGFHVALWRQGDLGYALVSDVNETRVDPRRGASPSNKRGPRRAGSAPLSQRDVPLSKGEPPPEKGDAAPREGRCGPPRREMRPLEKGDARPPQREALLRVTRASVVLRDRAPPAEGLRPCLARDARLAPAAEPPFSSFGSRGGPATAACC